MLGQAVYSEYTGFIKGDNQKIISFDGRLSEGMYFLQFDAGAETAYRKLYKAR